MLNYTYKLDDPLAPGSIQMTPFLAKAMNDLFSQEGLGVQLVSDPERFQLIAQETIKVGQPVDRNAADYWIEQVRARAGLEVIGRVKVEENTGALVPVKQ